jgi:ABC-2 type transport system permease protein
VIRLVGAELLKLRTTRTFWALAGSTFALILLILVLSLALSDNFDEEDEVLSLLSTAGLAGLLMLVLGAVSSAGEYRHGTIASTLLVTPDRLRAVGAQTLACAIGGLAVGLGASAITAAIGLPWLAAKDASMPPAGDQLSLFLGNGLHAALAAALGVAVGSLLRNQVAAIVLLLMFLFVIDPAISALAEDYAKFSLTGLSTAMSGGTDDEFGAELLPLGVAALIWALYTMAVMAAAAALTTRRDI